LKETERTEKKLKRKGVKGHYGTMYKEKLLLRSQSHRKRGILRPKSGKIYLEDIFLLIALTNRTLPTRPQSLFFTLPKLGQVELQRFYVFIKI
jgi:hypothetical protein